MRIADVLRRKGAAVHTAECSMSVSVLLRILAEQNIGALIVMDGERVAGIVSERDVVRHLSARGADMLNRPVSEIMTADLVTCRPEDTVNAVMGVMTERRFRHLPVIVDGRLAGIVSIGDMVSARMRELEQERQQLESYITS